jgi:hypothetical protein
MEQRKFPDPPSIPIFNLDSVKRKDPVKVITTLKDSSEDDMPDDKIIKNYYLKAKRELGFIKFLIEEVEVKIDAKDALMNLIIFHYDLIQRYTLKLDQKSGKPIFIDLLKYQREIIAIYNQRAENIKRIASANYANAIYLQNEKQKLEEFLRIKKLLETSLKWINRAIAVTDESNKINTMLHPNNTIRVKYRVDLLDSVKKMIEDVDIKTKSSPRMHEFKGYYLTGKHHHKNAKDIFEKCKNILRKDPDMKNKVLKIEVVANLKRAESLCYQASQAYTLAWRMHSSEKALAENDKCLKFSTHIQKIIISYEPEYANTILMDRVESFKDIRECKLAHEQKMKEFEDIPIDDLLYSPRHLYPDVNDGEP